MAELMCVVCGHGIDWCDCWEGPFIFDPEAETPTEPVLPVVSPWTDEEWQAARQAFFAKLSARMIAAGAEEVELPTPVADVCPACHGSGCTGTICYKCGRMAGEQ